MHYISQFIDYFLHINIHLQTLSEHFGSWTYAILFLIVFCETGLVVTPLLPGDSLLFAAGSLAALGVLNVHYLVICLISAALLGDNVNYWIGRWCGPKVFHYEKSHFFNPKYLKRAHEFYERYGGKTIIIARFVPIIRTFAPFVAGIGTMPYRRFIAFSITGAVLWVCLIVYTSYWFGNIPIVKQNFSLVILAIILLSLLPPFVEFLRQRFNRISSS